MKARLYASHGARELWVTDATERRIWVHKQVLRSAAIPELAIRLDQI